MLSRNFEHTLHRALTLASDKNHEYATCEHLLIALTEDSEFIPLLDACNIDLKKLRNDLENYINNELKNPVRENARGPKLTAGFQRVVQRAAIRVQSSGRDEVTGANVLVALFSERDCYAVSCLTDQHMTRWDAINYISHRITKNPMGESDLRTRLRAQGVDYDGDIEKTFITAANILRQAGADAQEAAQSLRPEAKLLVEAIFRDATTETSQHVSQEVFDQNVRILKRSGMSPAAIKLALREPVGTTP